MAHPIPVAPAHCPWLAASAGAVRRCGWLLPLLALLAAARPAAAQGWIGLATSNYGGTQNLYINPSTVADSRHRLYLNVAAADINFYNTYLQLDLPQAPWKPGFGLSEKYLNEQLTGGNKFASMSAELRLPSLMLALGRGRGFAFTNRARGFVQVSNVSENLARLSRYGLVEANRLGLANRLLEDNSFNINVNNYHEFALTYGQTFTPNTRHFFKGGLTVKYLVGLGGGYLLNDGTRYRVYGRDSIQLNTPAVSYGFSDYQLYQKKGFSMGSLYGADRLGQGFGADLGATYEWRPDYQKYEYRMDGRTWTDPSRNKYRLRLGLALTDLGAISYNNPRYVRQAALADGRTVQLGQLDTLKFANAASVGAIAQKLVGLKSQDTRFVSYLPATLRFTADYRVFNHGYAGLLWTQNLLPARTVGSRSISSLALTPRIEFSHLTLALPLILANNYQKLQIGALVRLGPLLLGSDNLSGLWGITTTTGADFYFGLGLALHQHRHHDRDGDQVSNKLDKCPKVKGTWEFRGCPDRDNDHVQDTADDCPDLPGLPQFKGCPDQDNDGLPDKADTCPTQAGPVALQGCPDRDQDGVKDDLDTCPDVPGPAALQGCPDRDADGVTDAADRCPDAPGPAAHQGCPDTDGDGLHDADDKCPAVAGPPENNGCPYGDQDGDAVPDNLDQCPTVAGPAANNGCPETILDTDGDTVPDPADACPLTPGPPANKGCPELKAEEIKVLKTAFANLEFETGRDIIRPQSLPALQELAALLVARPAFRLRLTGFTDNVGAAPTNLLLSRKRAAAVRRYLVQQGAPAAHIRAEGFGRARPVSTNKTAAGRARNRRVEMKVLFD